VFNNFHATNEISHIGSQTNSVLITFTFNNVP